MEIKLSQILVNTGKIRVVEDAVQVNHWLSQKGIQHQVPNLLQHVWITAFVVFSSKQMVSKLSTFK